MVPTSFSYKPTVSPRSGIRSTLSPSSELRALRRVSILSSLSGQLAQINSELALHKSVITALRCLFEPTHAVEFFVLGVAGQLCATGGDETQAHELLVSLGIASSLSDDRRLWAPNLVPSVRTRGRRSVIAAPVLEGGNLYGVLVVEGDSAAPDLSLPDLETLCAVAGQVALLLPRVRPQINPEYLRFRRDLALAGQLQRRFLPTIPKEVEGMRIAADYRPAFDVGGDFYGVVRVGTDTVTVVIGDVSGHGIAAALLMSRVSCDFHRLAKEGCSPKDILTQLNTSIAEQCPDDTFATAACLQFDLVRGEVTAANAGHLPLLIRRPSCGVLVRQLPTGTPLGMLPSEVYVEERFSLQYGDMVLLSTDGVIDALGHDSTACGMQRLSQLFAQAPNDVYEINRLILTTIEQASMGGRVDDVALVTVEMFQPLRVAA